MFLRYRYQIPDHRTFGCGIVKPMRVIRCRSCFSSCAPQLLVLDKVQIDMHSTVQVEHLRKLSTRMLTRILGRSASFVT